MADENRSNATEDAQKQGKKTNIFHLLYCNKNHFVVY